MGVVIICMCQLGEGIIHIFHLNTNLDTPLKYLKIWLISVINLL